MAKAKAALKEKAIKLRVGGKSYKEISKKLDIALSTLSVWLHAIKLTEKQARRLKSKERLCGKRAGDFSSKRHAFNRTTLFAEASVKHFNVKLTHEALALVGTALYWAEGTKRDTMKFSNADPDMVRLFLRWAREILEIPENLLQCSIQIHLNVGISRQEALVYWSEVTNIPAFSIKAYQAHIPRSSKQTKVGRLPYGTLYITLKKSSQWRAQYAALLLKLGKDSQFVQQPCSSGATKVVV
jgi:transposase